MIYCTERVFMEDNTKDLFQQRKKIYNDIFINVIPKRLPVSIRLSHMICGEYDQQNLHKMQYDFSLMKQGAFDLANKVYSDICILPGARSARLPAFYQILASKTFKISEQGYMQHPEVSGMNEEDYPYLIKDPLACIFERIIPRLYDNLDPYKNPVVSMMSLSMAKQAQKEISEPINNIIAELMDLKGYYPGAPRISSGGTEAPLDFLADVMRGFTKLSTDIRRNRDIVIEACETLYPLMFRRGLPSESHPEGLVMTFLHMAPYMREKDFAEIWFPTYKKMLCDYAALDVRTSAFCEQDWTRYFDYLQDLPANTLLRFEYGDPKIIKDKLGKKFILEGFYPLTLLNTGSKKQIIDKAKEILDIMMPGGGYLFNFDKIPHSNINIDNLVVLSEYLRDHAFYDHAGDTYGMKLNCEGYTYDFKKFENISSKYSFDFNKFKKDNPYAPQIVEKRFQRYYFDMMQSFMDLLV